MLALDEEVDYVEYQRYLRSQSVNDLLDIVGHLDLLHCPRRAEAASRELYRRQISSQFRYAESETLWRKVLIAFVVVLCATLLLAATMSPEEAREPQPPPSLDLYTDGNYLQFQGNSLNGGNQMTVAILGTYAAQIAENDLRAAVYFASNSGFFLVMLLLTSWKLWRSFKDGCHGDALKTDIRWLLLITLFGQIMLILTSAWNNLPLMVGGTHADCSGYIERAATIFAPWC